MTCHDVMTLGRQKFSPCDETQNYEEAKAQVCLKYVVTTLPFSRRNQPLGSSRTPEL